MDLTRTTEKEQKSTMRTRRIAGLATLVSAAALIVAAFAASPAQAVLSYDGFFGSQGTNGGQLNKPFGIAVNHTTGDVYVVEAGNNRISQFTAGGTFIRAWGFDVIKSGQPNDVGADFEICDTTAGNVVADCKAGVGFSSAGAFAGPSGIAVDNSTGPAAGSVYVQDALNLRVQRFTANGQFVLMWGKGVNGTSGGDLCPRPGFPGDTCQMGADTSEPVGFNAGANGTGGWEVFAPFRRITVDGDGKVYTSSGTDFTVDGQETGRIVMFDHTGAVIGLVNDQPGPLDPFVAPYEIAADADGNVYVRNRFDDYTPLRKFRPADFTPSGIATGFDTTFPYYGESPEQFAVDPTNQYLFVADSFFLSPCQVSAATNHHIVELTPSGELADCSPPTTPGLDNANLQINSLAVSPTHKLYLAVDVGTSGAPQSQIRIFDTPPAAAPEVSSEASDQITTNSARVQAQITANLASTVYRVEYGTEPCSDVPNPCGSTADLSAGASLIPAIKSTQLNDLAPETKYYYRFVVTNSEGSYTGPDKSFSTLVEPVFDSSCSNNLARQQTHAASLLDCRAYELVSAENQGGYNVESNVVAGQTPFGGYPQANDKALYAIHNGGIPGIEGKPTNRGPDPYLATRDAENQRWNTTYVGIPADVPSLAPFSATVADTDTDLSSFAFSGPEICNPCFGDGSAGIPIRGPDGNLVQGMVGSENVPLPEPAGGVMKHFSADGNHFLFASTQKFEPEGNDSGADVTIYDRDLNSETTQVVSTLPDGSTIVAGSDVRALGISSNGSRVLIGVLNHTDAEEIDYYDLYMHDGASPDSLELISGGSGALFAGMTSDGSQVFFTTRENLADDTDSSVDLFRATIDNGGAVSVERVSENVSGTDNDDGCDPAGNSYNPEDWNTIPGGPADCSVVALGGGGGVASDSGAVYFLSPEQLDGNGVAGAPNVFLDRPGEDPAFVETLESGATATLPTPSHNLRDTLDPFTNPWGAAIDKQDGSIYIYDAGATGNFGEPGAYVQKFDASGNPITGYANNSKLDGSADGVTFTSLADPSSLGLGLVQGFPTQIAVDNHPPSASYGDLYVPTVDLFGDGYVRKFDAAGNYLSSIVVAPSFSFLAPAGIAVDQTSGDLYVGLANLVGDSSVNVYDASGALTDSFLVSGMPYGLAVDSSGNLYVANGSSTEIYNLSGTHTGTLDADPSVGVTVDSTNDHVFVDEGDQVVEYAGGVPVGSPIGAGALSNSVNLAADSDSLVISNPGDGNVLLYGPPEVAASRAYDHPLVINGVKESNVRHTADFQTTANGEHAVFPSTRPLTGYASAGEYELYRYDAGGDQLDCASCNPTGLPPSTDARLATNGLSITDDGRVFFNTREALALRDNNNKLDAYEWSAQQAQNVFGACHRPDGCIELISSGRSSDDSSLLSVSADGTDAFFFTRETLATNDHNGNVMKLYTAREGGGFFVIPPQPECVASDECHGPSSTPAPPVDLGTLEGSGGNFKEPVRCDVRTLSRGAKRLALRVKALRRRAAHSSGERAKALREKARRVAKQAEEKSNATKRCRSQIRRAK